ncbi:uncharacterized protein BDZ83DRAFT_609890 [Colletotrichum acutatum]|uniref:Uncharacterized protein n=1 Tax=Glomerella acutata TaxID=27357 RepID=A0AAD8XJK0_GLOAC|nr:uncharacterized protein BDZ83DRAFT_609890 [Colletotrichum acutatum]KAK1728323.1 hypothetical protein BDZ83DRAFT_609890 [Colletotrichum acutatum]
MPSRSIMGAPGKVVMTIGWTPFPLRALPGRGYLEGSNEAFFEQGLSTRPDQHSWSSPILG